MEERSLSTIHEEELVGQWYAFAYKGRKREVLHVPKALMRFLNDEGGPVDKIRMRCLKPKVCTGDILEETPNHLPKDDWDFDLNDILCGPLEVTPHANRFVVKNMIIFSFQHCYEV